MHAIETHGLSKSYNKKLWALKGLDLEVEQNSIFGFLGPNGAGKTTTIKMLLGLVRPTDGSASVLSYDIVRESVKVRARVGYLPQAPRFYEHMTARETLRFSARFFYDGQKSALERRIEETLELVGLTDKADRPIKGFSGGELQRLGIGQAQVNAPSVLILDEPAASLDPLGRRDVLKVMERLRQYSTIFYSTHILDDVQRGSDTVSILNQGELVVKAPTKELLAGSGEIVYTMGLKGDSSAVQRRVEAQGWVLEIDVIPSTENDETRWHVTVTDHEAAETHLLRMVLSDEHVNVSSFGRKHHNLEEIFIGKVEHER
jgi:ABC-2 type transport system ATP-binding protein